MTVTAPEWVSSSLRVQDGRDPLGLQTTTQDRLTPVLLPGLLELSNRARYFSFHLFLLAEYKRRKLPSNGAAFSEFIRRREYELGLAVLLCERCESSPVGSQRVRPAVASGDDTFARGLSVKTVTGGYGLYYRSPLVAFGAIWPAGTELSDGESTLPIDVINDEDDVVREAAAAFREAVADTDYYAKYFITDDLVPKSVVEEYASVACLCRLEEHVRERSALRTLLLSPLVESMAEEVTWRRRAVAHYLTLVDADGSVVGDVEQFRSRLWTPPSELSPAHREVADRWAALVAKDAAQDALCSVWVDFLERGRSLAGWDPLSAGAARVLADELSTDDELGVGPDLLWSDVPRRDPADVEELRRWTEQRGDAVSGLLAFDAIMRAVTGRTSSAWRTTAGIGSAWQPSLLEMATAWQQHLAGDPTVSESMWWLLRQRVIAVHERIAYSKLPEFTFRFKSEPSGIRFYDLYPGRFILAAIRHAPLGTLTADLGFWDDDESPQLTADGRKFVQQVLG